jgi:hypothetical protein
VVVTVVPMVVVMAVVVVTAFLTPVVAVLWCRGLPGHHGGLVVGHRLHHTVLGLRLVIRDGLRIVGHHLGGAVSMVVLAGNAGTHQTACTGAYDRAVAATDLVADGSTGHGADTGTQNGVEIIRMGCGGQASQAAG